MAPSCYNSIFSKRKRTVAEKDYHNVLNVAVRHAEGIDSTTMDLTVEERKYCVVGWVLPDQKFCTDEAQGLPNPAWDVQYKFSLGRPDSCRYLYLEVFRMRCKSDPGTSTGVAMVGRTRIPLPQGGNIRVGRYGLVRPKGLGLVADGHIIISMEMLMVESFHYQSVFQL